MRVFVYEFVTGGGLYHADIWPPPKSLLCEGKAMAGAILDDLTALDGAHVSTLLDRRLPPDHVPAGCDSVRIGSEAEHFVAFDRCAREADWTLVIAPEFDYHLVRLVNRVNRAGGRVLGLPPDSIFLLSDKHSTAEDLRAKGIKAPYGVILSPDEPLPWDSRYPAVLKPIDGAGSQDVQLVNGADQRVSRRGVMRLENYQPGLPASIAFFCGPPKKIVPLLPCRQHLSDDGRFTYLGGSLPLPPALAERATRLALAAVRTLTGLLGYIGVDLVLGDNDKGRQDVVIEINPRLTTSYVGLRAAASCNLAAGMIALAEGRDWMPSWNARSVVFDADGTTRMT